MSGAFLSSHCFFSWRGRSKSAAFRLLQLGFVGWRGTTWRGNFPIFSHFFFDFSRFFPIFFDKFRIFWGFFGDFLGIFLGIFVGLFQNFVEFCRSSAS